MSGLLAKSAALSTSVRLAGNGGSPRSSSASGDPKVRPGLMPSASADGLLPERHTGRRRAREDDGQVATIRSNCRWCSDTLEFACWNGEVVGVAFALDCHDREAISWVATTANISGEMIRDIDGPLRRAAFRHALRAVSGAVVVR
jgi:transposase InsO family protein